MWTIIGITVGIILAAVVIVGVIGLWLLAQEFNGH